MRTSWFVLAFSLFLDLGKQGIQGSQSKFAAAGNVVRSSTSRSSPLSGEGQSGTQVQGGQRGSRGVWAASSSYMPDTSGTVMYCPWRVYDFIHRNVISMIIKVRTTITSMCISIRPMARFFSSVIFPCLF